MKNVESVKTLYEAFGRGDIAACMKPLSDSVDWDYGQSGAAPWLTHRRGRDGAAAFFESLAALDFKKFELKEVFGSADGAIVVALVDVEVVVKATGKTIREEDEIHLWRFDGEGRVARFRHGVDTAAHAAATRG